MIDLQSKLTNKKPKKLADNNDNAIMNKGSIQLLSYWSLVRYLKTKSVITRILQPMTMFVNHKL